MRNATPTPRTRPHYTRLDVLQMRYAARQQQAANCCIKAAALQMLSELTEFVNDFEPEGIYPPEDTKHVYPALQRFYDGLMEINARVHDELSR